MRTSGQILIPTVSYGNYWNATAAANNNPSYNPGYPNYNANTANNWAGDPVKAASYYRSPGGLQTVAYYCTNFVGNLIFEGTLESDPDSSLLDPLATNYPWFKIAEVTGLGQNTFLQKTANVPALMVESQIFNSGYTNAATAGSNISNVFYQSGTEVRFTYGPTISALQIGTEILVNASDANNNSFDGTPIIVGIPDAANVVVQYATAPSNWYAGPNSSGTLTWPVYSNSVGTTKSFVLNGQYPADQLVVSVNGIIQVPGSNAIGGAYTTVGSTLVFNDALPANATVAVREFYEPIATSNFSSQTIVANGLSNTFVLNNDSATYTSESVLVSVNGILQIPLPRTGSNANTSPLHCFAVLADESPVTGANLIFRFVDPKLDFEQLPPLNSNVNVNVIGGNSSAYNSNIYIAQGAVVRNITVDSNGDPNRMTLNFGAVANSNTAWQGGVANLLFPNLGSYILTSSGNSNTNTYVNTLVFDWMPQPNDVIEIREIAGGNIPIPAFTGVSALNLLGNFTWLRCRVKDFSSGVINKITISY